MNYKDSNNNFEFFKEEIDQILGLLKIGDDNVSENEMECICLLLDEIWYDGFHRALRLRRYEKID